MDLVLQMLLSDDKAPDPVPGQLSPAHSWNGLRIAPGDADTWQSDAQPRGVRPRPGTSPGSRRARVPSRRSRT